MVSNKSSPIWIFFPDFGWKLPVFPWFPWLEKVFKNFPEFTDFPDWWEPCVLQFTLLPTFQKSASLIHALLIFWSAIHKNMIHVTFFATWKTKDANLLIPPLFFICYLTRNNINWQQITATKWTNFRQYLCLWSCYLFHRQNCQQQY